MSEVFSVLFDTAELVTSDSALANRKGFGIVDCVCRAERRVVYRVMDGLSASKFSSKSHGGSVLPKEDGLDSSTITPGVRTAMPPFPPDSFRDNNETPNASVTGVGGGGGKASSRLESAMKREAHRKKGGSSWLDFFSFGRWRPGGGGRQQGAIQLAQSFGTPNQPGRPVGKRSGGCKTCLHQPLLSPGAFGERGAVRELFRFLACVCMHACMPACRDR